MNKIQEVYATSLFNDEVMKDMLPKEVYRSLRATINTGKPLNPQIADVVANAMKEWAIGKGATHFTHWFQPMTGMTAEKHDSFLSPDSDGRIIMEFSGKELIQGEPDASSFPSGGLRSTFEARGYTAWDPTSYAFVKDDVLCIPTAFCSYSGEALDEKTPLLRSMEVINRHMMRILKVFGTKAERVITTVGAEQEYFLIDEDVYLKRMDLLNCGRTLFGARPAKGQELDDHYFGAIKRRVHDYMKDLNVELWKLGINAKTEHNEAAPGQHELAPVYATTNIAVDQNQLVMEMMKKVAREHHMVCLLAEKPFNGVNGSGKHNNWSISTDRGVNLLDPGKTPAENAQFLLILSAVIKAVDEYQDLLRMSVASAGNDNRLGGNEAPPAIVSMFLGDELSKVLKDLEEDNEHKRMKDDLMEIGSQVLPSFERDNTDRNRTSPFAFTGNKFEFRMVGSSQSIAFCNTVLNTIVAAQLDEFATILETSGDIADDVNRIVKKTLRDHKRIIFNGNNYSEEWQKEAERRGLRIINSTPEAIACFADPKNVELFEKYKVLSKTEILSRCEVMYENYCKVLHIEALTMTDMVNKLVIPSIVEYEELLARTAERKEKMKTSVSTSMESSILSRISSLADSMYKALGDLEESIMKADDFENIREKALYYRKEVYSAMACLRKVVDELELIVAKKCWAYPSYGDLLYSVR